ncbi:aspartate ammonia-lyase [Nocardia donostiensis]|uniref:Aspartate ammonia-lyase n=1 Tax=Nocardia donostiensis TaxID=1538463 RepID=A0A1W0BAR2_9NOCA|nr:aspartate ammonia-lyase [Nocardia donostiensis]ONM46783.1 aspartate ammonia-lyase [Nocardia donostiensis]OQS19597.1 aspartate ammonia-lyase [Nocardia donostiensis]
MTMARTEHDLIGEREVPEDAYWGIHTLRARENFPITGTPISHYPALIRALALTKSAAAETNQRLGLLPADIAEAIVTACREIADGALHEHFVVDVVQGGAGTSTNMNANEVIANRALELMGRRRGEYAFIHPIEHVNLGQSTNDVYPTAVRIAVRAVLDELHIALAHLAAAFAAKAVEFSDHLKMGRTQLQDAVPMTLGQEFGTYAVMIGEDIQRLDEAARLIDEINLGGTAIGTRLNSHPDYAVMACSALSALTGYPLTTATDLLEATQDVGAFVQISGTLKRTAVKLSKVCNDLRLLASGPRAGLGEIRLPAVQAGSSIMPGKVNPVIPEVVSQVAYEVIGNDIAITMSAEAGQLQLNAFEPLIAHKLLESATHMSNAATILAQRCVPGITADAERMRTNVERSTGLITALNPHIGYEAATELAARALSSDRTVAELAKDAGLLSPAEIDLLLSPVALTGRTQVRTHPNPPDAHLPAH